MSLSMITVIRRHAQDGKLACCYQEGLMSYRCVPGCEVNTTETLTIRDVSQAGSVTLTALPCLRMDRLSW